MSPQELGRNYDSIAEEFRKQRSRSVGLSYTREFSRMLQPSSLILDIGCGTGRPLARYLVDEGHRVRGIDISGKMIEIVRHEIPEGMFEQGDILTWSSQLRFDGIIAWDSLFHLPLGSQHDALEKICALLAPRGVALLTFGGKEGEIRSAMFGHEFYYSSLDRSTYESFFLSRGYSIILSEQDQPGEDHLVMIVQNIAKR